MSTSPMPAEAPSLQRLSTLKLPTMPAGTLFLFESLADENIEFAELAELLEKFPSIAGRLISLANSVWSAPTDEVSSLENACARLGFGVVRSTSIALAIAAPFDAARCPAFDPERYWCGALLTADAASRLALAATVDDRPQPSTARAAGLLHELGLLWLVDKLPDEVDQALVMVEMQREANLQPALTRVLGFDQVKATARLADAWGLPESLATAMTHYRDADYQGPQKAIVATVGLAVTLVSAILADQPCPPPDGRLPALGIATAHCVEIHATLAGQLEKTRAVARVLV